MYRGVGGSGFLKGLAGQLLIVLKKPGKDAESAPLRPGVRETVWASDAPRAVQIGRGRRPLHFKKGDDGVFFDF